uniref:Aminopeptidase N-like n=1 Tax=Saccoglossus kowalevskii TaxID=10224 RepID=A0ABM0MR18_SACKO|nr:PREDICTED: aminopeptidase N-like [Saccoglossus kowalevskii]
MADPENNPIETSVRPAIYCIAIKFGSDKEWQFAHNQSLTNPEERESLRSAMGCSRNEILGRYIEEFTNDPSQAHTVIEDVRSKSAMGYSVAWHYVMNNFDALNSTLGESAYNVVWTFSPWMNTDYDLQQLLGFAARYPDMPSYAAQGFYEAKLKVETNIAWMKRNRQGITNWLNNVVINNI